MPTDAEVAEAAAEAAESTVFSHYDRSTVDDIDISAQFIDGTLTVDVYVDTGAVSPDERATEETVVEEAVSAARAAADRLFDVPSDA